MRASRLAPSAEDIAAVTAARSVALAALAQVRGGAPADDAIAAVTAADDRLDPADRALAHELVYGLLRYRRRLDSILARYARTGLPAEGRTLDALRMGAYSLISLDRVPAHAAVATAVEAVKRSPEAHAAGFVNACLRRMSSDLAAIRAETPPPEGAPSRALGEWWSFPDWMVDAFGAVAPGPELPRLLAALDSPAPLCLRATGDRLSLMEKLAAAGQVAEPGRYAPDCVVMREMRGAIPALPGFAEGAFAVQDEAAQLITEIVDPKPGEELLDVCAAPGGKAIHAASRGAKVTGIDADPHRLARIREAAKRLHVELTLFAEEVGPAPIGALSGRAFGKVLVDAPCSATGIIRRKPDVKWARRPEDIPRFTARQSAILGGAARSVAPGGLLVYAVCSLLRAEGESVVERFLGMQGEFRPVDLRDLPRAEMLQSFRTTEGFFRSSPAGHGTDGFFAAALRRLE